VRTLRSGCKWPPSGILPHESKLSDLNCFCRQDPLQKRPQHSTNTSLNVPHQHINYTHRHICRTGLLLNYSCSAYVHPLNELLFFNTSMLRNSQSTSQKVCFCYYCKVPRSKWYSNGPESLEVRVVSTCGVILVLINDN